VDSWGFSCTLPNSNNFQTINNTNMLQDINKVVITPGHGGGDPGAVSNGRTEADNVVKICGYIQKYYDNDKISGLFIEIMDAKNELNLQPTIDILNARYPTYNPDTSNNVLAIEIHQDQNAPSLPQDQQNRQMGIYYFQNDQHSQELANTLTKKFISYGAFDVQDGNPENFTGTWRRGHYLEWQGFYLGFVNNVNAWSIIIECGFVSGNNTDEDLKRFAWWIFQALKEIKLGNKQQVSINNQLEPVGKKELMLASNPYYLGLLRDKNIDLAVKDLVDRDIEIQELKANVLDLKIEVNKVNEFITKYQSLEQEFNKLQNKVPISSFITPNDKVTDTITNNAPQSNSVGGNFPTKGILPNLQKGHILEVLSTSGLALLAEFATFALDKGFDISKFEFNSNFLSLMIYWILIYVAHRLHFVIPDSVLVRIKDRLVK
jgi:N-acetylmuramoyl-L-alanine amidase